MEKNNLKPEKRRRAGNLSWNLMDHKYLSELLNIGSWKEKQMRLRLLHKKLALLPPDKKCRKDMMLQAQACGYAEKKKVSAAKLQEWTGLALVQAGRRIRMVQRKDLLPLIVTVAQLRYLHQLEQSGEIYQQECTFLELLSRGRYVFCVRCLRDDMINCCYYYGG